MNKKSDNEDKKVKITDEQKPKNEEVSNDIKCQNECKKNDQKLTKDEVEIANLTAKIKTLEEQIVKIENEQKQRVLAERLNTLKDQEKINHDFKQYANQRLLENTILPLLNNFQMALNYQTDDKNVQTFLNGFKYMFNNLKVALEKEGVQEIKVNPGEIFDSNIAEAVEINEVTTLAKNEKNNMITAVLANGYKLYDRVVITAKVKIIKLVKENEINMATTKEGVK